MGVFTEPGQAWLQAPGCPCPFSDLGGRGGRGPVLAEKLHLRKAFVSPSWRSVPHPPLGLGGSGDRHLGDALRRQGCGVFRSGASGGPGCLCWPLGMSLPPPTGRVRRRVRGYAGLMKLVAGGGASTSEMCRHAFTGRHPSGHHMGSSIPDGSELDSGTFLLLCPRWGDCV